MPPLPPSQCRRTHPGCPICVVASDDQARIFDRIRRCVIAVEVRVEVEDAAILLPQPAIPVIAKASGKRESRRHLELVLNIATNLVRAIVPARVALQKRTHIESGRRAARRHVALCKRAQVIRRDRAGVRALVDRVQLRVAVAPPKVTRVLAQRPDRVARRLPAILEYAGVGGLPLGVRADVQDASARKSSIGCSTRPAR